MPCVQKKRGESVSSKGVYEENKQGGGKRDGKNPTRNVPVDNEPTHSLPPSTHPISSSTHSQGTVSDPHSPRRPRGSCSIYTRPFLREAARARRALARGGLCGGGAARKALGVRRASRGIVGLGAVWVVRRGRGRRGVKG